MPVTVPPRDPPYADLPTSTPVPVSTATFLDLEARINDAFASMESYVDAQVATSDRAGAAQSAQRRALALSIALGG